MGRNRVGMTAPCPHGKVQFIFNTGKEATDNEVLGLQQESEAYSFFPAWTLLSQVFIPVDFVLTWDKDRPHFNVTATVQASVALPWKVFKAPLRQ